MKIAVVTNFFMNKSTGIPTFIRDLSESLEERNHKVSVVSAESLPEVPKKDFEKSVGEYFNELNKKENYDLVICNGEMGYSVRHPKAINVFHGNYHGYAMAVKDLVSEEIVDYRLERAKVQKKSSEGKYVVAVSNFAVQGLENSGIRVDEVINNTADSERFYPIETGILDHVIYTARGKNNYYEKGFDILEKLVAMGIKLRLFSDTTIDSGNVENRFFVKNGELMREYNQAQCLLQPTRFEGGSLITLEAMACGCPVITTEVGYGQDIKKEIPEFVVDLNNPEYLDEFLEKYNLITQNRKDFSEKALVYFNKNHNLEKFKSKWVSLIERL
jgi:glycosyltransferase involved in cell wall biosynthesis